MNEEDDNNDGGDTIKEDERGGTGNTCWGNEKCIQNFSQKT